MKVTLIHPPALMAKTNYSTITQPHLGLGYLSAYLLEQGHEVEIIDAVGESVSEFHPWPRNNAFVLQGLSFDQVARRIDPESGLIGFACMFTHAWPMIRELIRFVHDRFPNIPLIAGGEHITSLPDSALAETPLTLCVLGEGEETLAEVVDRLEKGEDFRSVAGIAYLDQDRGQVVKTDHRPRIRKLDQLPWPAWQLMDPLAYLDSKVFIGPRAGVTIPMLASRGCPFSCTFCSSSGMWGNRYLARDVKDVVDEMEHYMEVYGATDFQFQDLTAIITKKWIVSFCRELIGRNLGITWQIPVGTRSEGIDREVADLLIASGCRYVQYAPESGSKRILTAIKKRLRLEKVVRSAMDSVQAGMTVGLLMIVGFPDETPEDLKQSFRFIRRMARLGVHELAVSVLVPLPGTEIYHDLKDRGLVRVDDDFCYWMSGATTLTTARSWNPLISSRKLLYLKLSALAQFYLISWAAHPDRFIRILRNLASGRQESKVDRVLREIVEKIKILFRMKKED